MAKARARRRWAGRVRPRFRGKRSFTLPLAMVAGLAPGIGQLWKARPHGLQHMANVAARNYIGYDPDAGKMTTAYLGYGLFPIIAGFLVHALAGKVGINRALARAGIPVLRL